eukprot:jgi/Tetstr1/425771/TSEL_001556.t1
MSVPCAPGLPNGSAEKFALIGRVLAAKDKSGKSFDEIADALGLCNVYCAQLFYNQAQLKPGTVSKLKAVVPGISDADLEIMQRAPVRSYDPSIIQEPLVYRLNEAVMHYGDAMKAITNEKFGDGIMSAIDFYMSVDKLKGLSGEDRVVITFNGKFLPHVEQLAANDVSKLSIK